MGKFFDRILVWLASFYLRFVYSTSRVQCFGNTDLLKGEEKFIVGFWHGDSYCYYPILKGLDVAIVTTENRRGDYISGIGQSFGYIPVRLPDLPSSGSGLVNIRRLLSDCGACNTAISMDGPNGPHHIPQRFLLSFSYLSKKRIIPFSIKVNRKITAFWRWDKYVIPLPFSKISFTYHDPVSVDKNSFEESARGIVTVMENK